MLNEYVKWTTNEENDVIEHIGILTKETENEVYLLTKFGEMCVSKDDGEFVESTREEFELIANPVKEVVVITSHNEGSKSKRAVDIYLKMRSEGKVRKDIINEFKSQLNMSDQGASTYYQNAKKSTGQ